MESAGSAQSDVGSLMRTVAKIVRFRRGAARERRNGGEPGTGLVSDDGGIRKVGFAEHPDGSFALSRPDYVDEDDEKQQQLRCREAMESLIAELFAGVSAIKAAYAQLQVAQSPYDPGAIQSADAVLVSELKRLSQLKYSYLQKQFPGGDGGRDSKLLAEVKEQRNLLRTFQITARKLESDLKQQDSEVDLLKNQLREAEALNRWMEEKAHPSRSLHMLGALHLSALDPTHFLAVLRYTVRSIRSFVKLLGKEMGRAGWDLDAAAGSISPDVICGKPGHWDFAFESYVCRVMFSGFQHHDFGYGGGATPPPLPDRRRFFEEILELKAATVKEILHDERRGESPFSEFCRAKYLSLVHPRMEVSFFGNLNQRNLIGSGGGFPGTEFFMSFAEVARRVWLLHRLFFSFHQEAQAAIFQVGRGCRFSEVYMESVVQDAEAWCPVVGFTVVPGFRVGRMVIQCKVYPAMAVERR